MNGLFMDSLSTSDISDFDKRYILDTKVILLALSEKRQLRKFRRKLGLYLVSEPDLTQFPCPFFK
jgi:hypothetical protein